MSDKFAYILKFPGGTMEQYDKVVEKANLGGKLAEGGIFHLASVTDEGVQILDVWESKEAFDKFFSEKLSKVLQEEGINASQPEIWPVHNILK